MTTTTRRQQPFGKSVSLAVLAVFCLLGGWLLAPLVAPSVARQRANGTPSGGYLTQNIEDIARGQSVLAVDPATGRLEPRRVVQTFVRTADHLRVLEFEDAAGRQQTLETTDEHPFWLPERAAFVAAGNLEVGDTVTGPAGELQSLVATTFEPHPAGVTVYNFEVEDYHTYFVAAHGPRGPPVLVHNADYTDATEDAIIYVRVDGNGGEYVGQAVTEERYLARQREHAWNHPDERFTFDVLERVPQNSSRSLNTAEEDWIRAGGGAQSTGGSLQNMRHQMEEAAYRAGGGTVDYP